MNTSSEDRNTRSEDGSRAPTRRQVVIVGAGMAGLTAARRLQRFVDVVVLDKGRGVGGRLATRRVGDATFDHGAQFLTTRAPEFTATAQELLGVGIIREWFDGHPDRDGVHRGEGHIRYCGVQSMNAIAKHLASGLDVRTSTHVDALERDGSRWRLRLADGNSIVADGVVATAPVPQSLAMLERGSIELAPSDATALRSIDYEPCLALLVALDGPSGIPEPGVIRCADGPIDWIADNHVKGVSSAPAVTIHATADLSRQRWDDDIESIAAELLAAADLRASPRADGMQIQRWRFARPSTMSELPCRALDGLPPIVCAGDAFGGPRVEGAAISGAAASDELLRLLDATVAERRLG